MKNFILIILCFVSFTVRSQSFNYYHVDGPGKWQCITVLLPPGHERAAKMFYNSSVSEVVQSITEIRSVDKDTVSASLVTFGTSVDRYIIASSSAGKSLILSDEKQLVTTVFTLDSSLFNVVAVKPVSNSSAAGLLKLAARLLLF
jgi:hypothetical protein